MNTIQTVVAVLQLISAIVIVAVVLLQEGKSAGISGSIAGGAETFFGKNKGRTIEAVLAKWTTVIAALFIILTVALNAFGILGK